MLPSSDVLTKTYPSFGSVAVPPQFDPPIDPGKTAVLLGVVPG